MSTRRTPRVAVIGAGMSGLCVTAKLREAGIDDIVIYEKADQIGGTWRDNTYPGLNCDIPSRLYCYSFAPNPEWTRLFPPGAEIQEYLRKVAKDLDLERHVRFGAEVDEAEWIDGQWHVRTKDGATDSFDFLVSAAGILHHPRVAEIPGMDGFGGAMFHSARWDHSVPLDGRRVAVIGSGSTATQITVGLSPRCAEYKLFGRTPQWVYPAANPGYSRLSRLLLRTFPALNRHWGRITYKFYQLLSEDVLGGAVVKPGWQRVMVTTMCHLHLRRVRDRALRERLRPTDKPACKRLIIASKFYKRFNDGDAELVDTPIECITERGIRTIDGHEHEVDLIVLATGFYAQNYLQPVELIGPDGLRLSKLWSGDPRGYRTVALPEFPNFFLLLGPHSPVGNQSLFTITENQVRYVMQLIERWRDGEFDSAAPTEEATDRFQQEIRDALPNTTWASGCQSWYIGKGGLPVLWPFLPRAHRHMLATPDLNEWTFSTASPADAAAPSSAVSPAIIAQLTGYEPLDS